MDNEENIVEIRRPEKYTICFKDGRVYMTRIKDGQRVIYEGIPIM